MKCTKCSLHEVATQPVPGVGQSSAIMIVGRNPGYDEDREGLPFVGGAGRVLNALLADANIRRSQSYVTNVVKCLTKNNEPPTEQQVMVCSRAWLVEEIQRVNPNVIIALGNEAMTALTGKVGITQYRGSVLPCTLVQTYKVLPTFHPSYIMRGNQRFWTTVVRDLEVACKESDSKEIHKLPTSYMTYSPTEHNHLLPLLLNSRNPISFDIETPGTLKPWEGGILGISISYQSGHAIHFKWNIPEHREVVKSVLEGPAPKIVQRGTFDCFYLKYHGVVVNNLYFDTKIAAHMVSPILPNDLAFLTSVYTDINYYKPYGGGAECGRMTPAALAEYNNTDADATRRVMPELRQELQDEGAWELFQRNMALVWVVSDMQLKGVKIDQLAVKQEVEAIDEMTRGTEEIFLSKGINIRSAQQIGELLVSLGLPLKRTAKSEQYKTDAETLSGFNHPVVNRILQFRELDKLRSTFLEAMKEKMVNGRIHTTYSITGTKTGRLSSSDPNLQNIPKRTRHIFVPDGGVYVEADYSQFEIRIIAAVAREEKLEQDLSDGVNIHLAICQEVYGREEVSERELFRAKSIVFGTTYGRTPESIAREYKISTAEAARIQGLVQDKYPGIRKYKNGMEGVTKLKTVFGRVKYLEGNVKEMYNFPIQSTGGDILLGSLVLLHERLGELGRLALTVHDNIVVDTTEENADKVVSLMREVMHRPIPELGNRTFPTKVQWGYNWRDLQPLVGEATIPFKLMKEKKHGRGPVLDGGSNLSS